MHTFLINGVADIITVPESIAVRVNQQENGSFPETSIEYGKFQCATRGGVLPLWLIDGVSAASIKTRPGFEELTYSVHSLPENGTLTLLYVPGSVETNNSGIRCVAFTDGKVVEYSDIALFSVYYCELIYQYVPSYFGMTLGGEAYAYTGLKCSLNTNVLHAQVLQIIAHQVLTSLQKQQVSSHI